MKFSFKPYIGLSMVALLFLGLFACEQNNNDDDDNTPDYNLIDSLVSDKDTIWSGPQDPATITCYAPGNDVEYLWFSELGDIQVQNSEGSKILFTAADCCEGVREIFCTAKDAGGSDTDTITLYVLVDYSK